MCQRVFFDMGSCVSHPMSDIDALYMFEHGIYWNSKFFASTHEYELHKIYMKRIEKINEDPRKILNEWETSGVKIQDALIVLNMMDPLDFMYIRFTDEKYNVVSAMKVLDVIDILTSHGLTPKKVLNMVELHDLTNEDKLNLQCEWRKDTLPHDTLLLDTLDALDELNELIELNPIDTAEEMTKKGEKIEYVNGFPFHEFVLREEHSMKSLRVSRILKIVGVLNKLMDYLNQPIIYIQNILNVLKTIENEYYELIVNLQEKPYLIRASKIFSITIISVAEVSNVLDFFVSNEIKDWDTRDDSNSIELLESYGFNNLDYITNILHNLTSMLKKDMIRKLTKKSHTQYSLEKLEAKDGKWRRFNEQRKLKELETKLYILDLSYNNRIHQWSNDDDTNISFDDPNVMKIQDDIEWELMLKIQRVLHTLRDMNEEENE